MLACWKAEPTERPSFSDLADTLGDLLQRTVQRGGKDYIPLGSRVESWKSSKTFREKTLAVTNLSYMHVMVDTLDMFEEMPCEDASHGSEEGDSGMVLPSEELQRLSWRHDMKECSHLHSNGPSKWDSDQGGCSAPDNNWTFFYPSL